MKRPLLKQARLTLLLAVLLAIIGIKPALAQDGNTNYKRIDIDVPTAYLTVDDKYILTATVYPAESTNMTWESANPEIATIDNDGIVTGVALGTTTVTATSVDNPSLTITSEINVVEQLPYEFNYNFQVFDKYVNILGLAINVDTLVDVAIPERIYNDWGKYGKIWIPYWISRDSIDGERNIIRSVSIPKTITRSSDGIFANCEQLTTVRMNANINSSGIFENVPNLKNIIIGEYVNTIAGGMFARSGIEDLNIPDHITTIGSLCFYQCNNLSKITIGKGIRNIGDKCFADGPAATVYFNADTLETEAGTAFSNREIEALYFGENVRGLCDNAFREVASVGSITCYSENPPVLGNGVFSSADLSKCELHVPKGSEKRYMLSNIWKEMKLVPKSLFIHNLEGRLVLGVGVRTQLQASVFGSEESSHKIIWKSDNPSVATVDENGYVIAIAKGSAKISATSESDPELTDICVVNVVEEYPYVLNGYYSSDKNGFVVTEFKSDKLVDVVIPERMLDNSTGLQYNTVAVVRSAFQRNSNVRSIVIPKTINEIDSGAFRGCANLETVWYETNNFKPALENRPYYSSGLWNDYVVLIGENPIFADCNKLKNIYIGSEVKTIPYCLFRSCAIEKLVIPDNVEVLEAGCFQDCESLSSITIGEGVTVIDANAFALKEGTTIATELFFNTANLQTYIVEDNFQTKGQYWICFPFDGRNISKLYFGGNVEVVDPDTHFFNRKYAFQELGQLTDIYCPKGNPIKLSTNAFSATDRNNCVIHVPDGYEQAYKADDFWGKFFYYDYKICIDNENLNIVIGEESVLTACVVPDRATKFIWESDNPEVADVNENGLVTGKSSGIATITVRSSSDPTLTAICKVTVAETKLYSLELNYIASRGGYIVTGFNADKPVDVVIPTRWHDASSDEYHDVVGIDESAFKGNNNIISVVIPENVRNIAPGAFAGCEELQTIHYNAVDLMTSNDANPNHNSSPIFDNCPKLKNIFVGEKIESLPAYVFKSADPEYLEIPHVSSFGEECFDGWTKLMEIHCYLATPPALQDDIFSAVDKTGCTIRVPDGFTNAYANANVWKDFLTILGHNEIPVTALTLNLESAEIEEDGNVQLTADVTPDDATDKSVTWSSSDESIATVDSEGKVTGVKAGVVTITATTARGLTATCEVTVKAKATEPEQPEQPTDPEKPTDPEQPTDPEKPEQPTDPENPDDGTDAIEDVAGDTDVCVAVEGGAIIVTAPEGATIEVYGITGTLVRSTREHRIDGLTRGVYLIRIGSRSFKVAI